jgi:hypothetical protein
LARASNLNAYHELQSKLQSLSEYKIANLLILVVTCCVFKIFVLLWLVLASITKSDYNNIDRSCSCFMDPVSAKIVDPVKAQMNSARA